MADRVLHDVSWERMIGAVEKVRERFASATAALERAGVPHAVVGRHAVAAWVARVDQAAVRNTQDVDLILRRADLDAAKAALAAAGFVDRHRSGLDMFLDGPGASGRDAVHVVFAGEKVRPDDALPAPDVDDSEAAGAFRGPTLEALRTADPEPCAAHDGLSQRRGKIGSLGGPPNGRRCGPRGLARGNRCGSAGRSADHQGCRDDPERREAARPGPVGGPGSDGASEEGCPPR